MFDPYNFFLLARRLLPGDEARMRTAVSRAYYSAFLLVRDRLGVQGSSPEVHRAVLAQLRSHREYRIAQRLHWVRRMRNKADYDTQHTLTAAQAKGSLSWADEVIQWVRQP